LGVNLHSHSKRILSSLQRQFALKITKANRHTSTDAVLQLAGLLPIDLILFKEYTIGKLFRLKEQVNIDDQVYTPDMMDLSQSRWVISPFDYFIFNSIATEEPMPRQDTLCYYTDGSKTEEGVGASFCVYDNNICLYSWNSKLSPCNTIYQAETFAILNALNWHLNHYQTRSFIIFLIVNQ